MDAATLIATTATPVDAHRALAITATYDLGERGPARIRSHHGLAPRSAWFTVTDAGAMPAEGDSVSTAATVESRPAAALAAAVGAIA